MKLLWKRDRESIVSKVESVIVNSKDDTIGERICLGKRNRFEAWFRRKCDFNQRRVLKKHRITRIFWTTLTCRLLKLGQAPCNCQGRAGDRKAQSELRLNVSVNETTDNNHTSRERNRFQSFNRLKDIFFRFLHDRPFSEIPWSKIRRGDEPRGWCLFMVGVVCCEQSFIEQRSIESVRHLHRDAPVQQFQCLSHDNRFLANWFFYSIEGLHIVECCRSEQQQWSISRPRRFTFARFEFRAI